MIDTPFQLAVRKNIRRTIQSLRGHGTCGMSLANLRQVTPTPHHTVEGAPVGPEGYNEIFAQVVASSRAFSAFIL